MDDPDDLLIFELDESERHLLRDGLVEWDGPARCTEEMARAMGFESVEDLFVEKVRLLPVIATGGAMTRYDWLRVLLATEVAFASATIGSGWDWHITTSFSDAEALVVLRSVQKKLLREVSGLIGNGLGTLPARPVVRRRLRERPTRRSD